MRGTLTMPSGDNYGFRWQTHVNRPDRTLLTGPEKARLVLLTNCRRILTNTLPKTILLEVPSDIDCENGDLE